MTDSQKLNAERSRLELEMKAMHNAAEGRAWTPEEEAKFNAVVEQINAIDERLSVVEAAAMLTDSAPVAAEQNSIDQQIERAIEARIEKINKITSVSTRRSAPSPIGVSPMIVNDLNDKRAERDRALALRGWMLGREANSEEIAAADRVGLNLRSDKLALRANSTSSSAGGYTIPQGFLAELEKKILWLASWTIHNANHLRESRDGLKVGGHQASSASLTTIMTALYFRALRAQDRVAVKPHASPVFHAIQYIMGRQSRDALER